MAPGESKQAGWHRIWNLNPHILRNGSNPLDLLEDLCKLGPCFVVPVTDGIPFLDEMEPEDCYLKWDVKLHAACGKDAIDDVFMFVQDEMKLTLSPLEQVEAPCAAAAVPAPRRGAGSRGRDGRAGGRGCCRARRRAARRKGGAEAGSQA